MRKWSLCGFRRGWTDRGWAWERAEVWNWKLIRIGFWEWCWRFTCKSWKWDIWCWHDLANKISAEADMKIAFWWKRFVHLEKMGWIRAQSTAPASLKVEEKDPNEREKKRRKFSGNVNLKWVLGREESLDLFFQIFQIFTLGAWAQGKERAWAKACFSNESMFKGYPWNQYSVSLNLRF